MALKKQPFISLTLFSLLSLCLALILSACGATSTASNSNPVITNAPAPTAVAYPTNPPAPVATTAPAATTAAAAATTTAANNNPPIPQPTIDQNPLKAGAVDDNLKFDEYLQYLGNYRDRPALSFNVSERYIISVMDGNGRTVANSSVKVYDGQRLLFQGKTYSNGQVLFFPNAVSKTLQTDQFDVVVEKSGRSTSRTFKRNAWQSQNGSSNIWTIELAGSFRPAVEVPANLDLLFLLDSTGSMGGEIRKIQQTINDIAAQISELPGTPKIRYGVVTYRDRGDSYITRKFGFTESLSEFTSFLNSISASGGGDTPESLNEALHVAVNDMNWNNGDALRLAFLVADAPPHLDYPQDYKYTDEAVIAVQKGIKVYTIGASGLDKQGEYVFRQIAQITLAQFLFITRGGDEAQTGSGGAASNTDVVYQEKNLDKIVVNIVRRELTNLTQ